MREINNNPNSLNFSGVQKLDQQKENSAPQTEVAPADSQAPQKMQDLSLMPSSISGRAFVSTGDSIDNDIKFLMKNPEFCKKANELFDMAVEQVGYEHATKIMDAFVTEFQK